MPSPYIHSDLAQPPLQLLYRPPFRITFHRILFLCLRKLEVLPILSDNTDMSQNRNRERKEDKVKDRARKLGLKSIESLYKWKQLATFREEADFAELEKKLYQSGIHTKTFDEIGEITLAVRSTEYDYAKDLVEGNVTEIVNTQLPEYRMFTDDLEISNPDFLISNDFRLIKKRTKRSVIFLIVCILIIFTLSYLYASQW